MQNIFRKGAIIIDKLNALEAILFASSTPVPAAKIAESLSISSVELADLFGKLNARESGLCALQIDDCYQLCTKVEYSEIVTKTLDNIKKTELSPAALEVLAIYAYNQPCTKSYAESVRGVDCSYIVNSLVKRGLLEEAGRLNLPGRPITYRTTENFLRCFNLKSLADLPEIEAATDEQSA